MKIYEVPFPLPVVSLKTVCDGITDVALDALTEARLRVEYDPLGHFAFVCNILNEIGEKSRGDLDKACTMIRDEIRNRLGRDITLNTWLVENHGCLWEDVRDSEKMRAYRLMWIDNMIAEIS